MGDLERLFYRNFTPLRRVKETNTNYTTLLLDRIPM